MKNYIFIFLLFFSSSANSQSFYLGYNFDFNSSLGSLHTFAADVHAEARIGKKSNWYCNWDFAMGANANNDLYGRANITILAYGSRNYWQNISHNTNSVGEAIGVLLGPLLCPVGLTNYFYTTNNKDLRIGLYLNPLILDYWDMNDPIRSWSIHGGIKALYHWRKNANFYIKFGGINLYNTFHYQNSGRYDGLLLNFSFGTLYNLD